MRSFAVSFLAVMSAFLVAGCLNGAVVLEVEEWEMAGSSFERGSTTYHCSHGVNKVSLSVENKAEMNVDLGMRHWQAVWDGLTDVRVNHKEGAGHAPPGHTVSVVLYFCTPEAGAGRPDNLILFDRPVYGADTEPGAIVVAKTGPT